MCQYTCQSCGATLNQREVVAHECQPRPDFTEAARAEAERRWTPNLTPGHPLSMPDRLDRRVGFRLGAEWARRYLREANQ